MRLRDLFVGTAVLCVAVIHFILQWMGWKAHLEELVLQWGLLGIPSESLWSLFSFPLFTLVPRSAQHVYFFSLLVANSLLWGATLVHGSSAIGRAFARRFRRRRSSRPVPPLTEAEQLAELRWLSERGLISAEQYRLRSEVILHERVGSPLSRPGITAPKPGTRLEPRKMQEGPEHHFDRSLTASSPLSRGLARGR
jgi:hypothetical protein